MDIRISRNPFICPPYYCVQGDQTEWDWSLVQQLLISSDNIATAMSLSTCNLLNHKILVVNSPIFALCNKGSSVYDRLKSMKGPSNHSLMLNFSKYKPSPTKRIQISFLCKAFFIAGFCRMQEGRKIYLLSLNDKNKQNNL